MYMHNRKAMLLLMLLLTAVVLTYPSAAFAAQESASVRHPAAQSAQTTPGAALTPVYGTGTRQVDREETICNLPDNDVERLPQRKTYTDTNGRGPDATISGDLKLAEVKYKLVGCDQDGIPNNYTAHVVYRGEETYTALLYYEEAGGEPASASHSAPARDVADADAANQDQDIAAGAFEPPIDTEPEYDAYTFGAETGANDVQAEIGADGADSTDTDNSVMGDADAGSDGGPAPAAELLSRIFRLFGTLSPVGAATLATLVAAVTTLLVLSFYNRRKAREAS